MENKKRIYADHAATTPVSREVIEAMAPCFSELWGNPSSLHTDGQRAKELVDAARAKVAAAIGCEPAEVYFTSCGSESDNWAIKGAAHLLASKRKKIVTSKIEHHAVLHTCAALEKEGFEVVYVGVDAGGFIDMDELRAAVDENTALVAIMMANNEIGTIEPIREIAEIAHERGALMFTDAVQAVGNIPVDVKALGVDMLALSGHKLHAPKGIGALYIRKGLRIPNLIDGGGQEKGRRGGTENVPYIVGLGVAIEDAVAKLPEMARVRALRERLIDGLLTLPYSRLNGDRECRLPGNVNISFSFVEGESLLLLLDMEGISASTGSACSSNSLEASHVLLSIGVDIEDAHGSLRFSLSHSNTEDEVDSIVKAVRGVVERLRAMSPIYPAK
ncbi:MAG: cysteine desulfurase NifS [Ruminococcaceae bacterium]|nr:cysteine desulfurase NifS [Oscillospiraceae bacterium]